MSRVILPRDNWFPTPYIWTPRVFWSPGYPCCCGGPVDCGTTPCTHTVTGNMVLDLGAGGWTSDTLVVGTCCDANNPSCEEVAGEYTLSPGGIYCTFEACCWTYDSGEDVFCYQCNNNPDFPYGRLVMILELVPRTAYTEFAWHAVVSTAQVGIAAVAEYLSDDFTGGGDCYNDAINLDGKIELTKYSDTASDVRQCSGALPATIYAWKE